MNRSRTEFAHAARTGMSGYVSLAQRSGKSLEHIVELATQDRLGELFDERGFVGRPQSGAEALRRLDALRHDPTVRPLTGAAAMVMLRSRMRRWDNEIAERDQEGRARAEARLEAIWAKRIPPWAER
jgi:hypothetical protein